MKRATLFMEEKVSYKGGFLWSYTSDFSRQWGEMEAYKTMIWIQPPGTPTMGNLFLDAYHATKDEYYYQSALRTAKALIKAQHPSGGWNYVYDFAGETSIKKWYNTIGANGWRLEEFQHYYGNATFDDCGTMESATLLLRLYLERKDPAIKTSLDKAIQFVLKSQYPNGGWPQRYPKTEQFKKQGHRDYTADITFNDDVAIKNINFLIQCYHTLGDKSLLDPIHKGMEVFMDMQMPQPQPGWAMQYSQDGKPAGARSYEPVCLSSATTESNIFQLMNFYRLTGDKKYMTRIPEAIDWLDKLRLPDSLIVGNKTHPSFIELGTNKPLYIHRRGSNVTNGEYYADYNSKNTVSHYGSTRTILTDSLRKTYTHLMSLSPEKVTEGSILKAMDYEFPPYIIERDGKMSDMNARYLKHMVANTETVKKLIADLNTDGYWPALLTAVSNPYIGPAPKEVTPGEYNSSRVGDKYDTSPYINKDSKIKGINTGIYIKNMDVLIEYLQKLN
ncbi:MAG: pectate lyase [Bacteroidota bacterium]